LTGGDRLTVRPGEGSGVRLYNNYGPTEYTVVATAGEVVGGEERERPPAIGRPVGNTRAYVLGRGGEEQPVGVAGGGGGGGGGRGWGGGGGRGGGRCGGGEGGSGGGGWGESGG